MSGYLGILASTAGALLAQPAPLIVGDLVLLGHEVPSRINIGGAQSVTIHKMPGGRRIIDAMGTDDGAIGWQGIFIGPDAARRARLLDIMRQQGVPKTLSFGDYTFNIIITHYECDYQDRGAVISYRIKSEIIPDGLNLDEQANGLDFALQNDLTLGQDIVQAGASAMSFYASVVGRADNAQFSGSVGSLGLVAASLNASVAASTTTNDITTNRMLETNLSSTGSTILNAIQAIGAGYLTASETGIVVGSSSALAAATGQAAGLAALVRAGGYVNRAGANLISANAQIPIPLVHA